MPFTPLITIIFAKRHAIITTYDYTYIYTHICIKLGFIKTCFIKLLMI